MEQKEKKATEKITIQLEEINQKILVNEGRLKRDRQKNKTITDKIGHSKTTKENAINKFGGYDTKTYQQPDARETEQFWSEIWKLT